MNAGPIIITETTQHGEYRIEVAGPLSLRNGGPWSARVFNKDWNLTDALFGNQSKHEAHQTALASVKEEIRKGRLVDHTA